MPPVTELRCFPMSEVVINFVSLGVLIMAFIILLVLYVKK